MLWCFWRLRSKTFWHLFSIAVVATSRLLVPSVGENSWLLVDLAKKIILIGSMNLIHFDLLSVHSWAVPVKQIKCYNHLGINVFLLHLLTLYHFILKLPVIITKDLSLLEIFWQQLQASRLLHYFYTNRIAQKIMSDCSRHPDRSFNLVRIDLVNNNFLCLT